MKIERVKIETLSPNPKNVRIHTETQTKEFARSIEQFGQIRPAVIDENGMLLVGHGLVKALKYLGKDEVDVYRITGLSAKEKDKLMLADNKIYTLGNDNFDNIDAILSSINDFDIPGYNSDDLKMLYGNKDIVEVMGEYKIENETNERKKIQNKEGYEIPKDVVEKQQEVERKLEERPYCVCPNCGTRIELD